MDDRTATTYWAGPALMTGPDRAADSSVAVLLLWRHGPADGAAGAAALLERGFARLPEPGLEQLRALPHLPGIGVRLPADGRLRVEDGPAELVEAAAYHATDEWHTSARAGRLVLLVDVEPSPDRDTPDGDAPSTWAMARLTEACRNQVVFGARVDLVGDDEPPDPQAAAGSGWK